MKSMVLRSLIALGALLVFGVVNVSIFDKERIKRDGEIVYLPLAPVDPRSLIQGDYMALRFELALEIDRLNDVNKHHQRNGAVAYAAVKLDEKQIATLTADANTAIKIRYRIREGHAWIGTNAFFFEEGTSQRYENAKYGEFRVDRNSGEAILVGLRNNTLAAL